MRGLTCGPAHVAALWPYVQLAERMEVEKEAVKIQTNVRAWLLQRNYKIVRQSVTRLQAGAWTLGRVFLCLLTAPATSPFAYTTHAHMHTCVSLSFTCPLASRPWLRYAPPAQCFILPCHVVPCHVTSCLACCGSSSSGSLAWLHGPPQLRANTCSDNNIASRRVVWGRDVVSPLEALRCACWCMGSLFWRVVGVSGHAADCRWQLLFVVLSSALTHARVPSPLPFLPLHLLPEHVPQSPEGCWPARSSLPTSSRQRLR